jgi:hypothetical protein
MRKKALIAGICYTLFVLFVYASSTKLMAYSYFLDDLRRSPVLLPYAVSLSIVIPSLELLIAALLLSDKTRKSGLIGSFLMMLLFTGYVLYVLTSTTERPCSCGGIIRELTWPQHLVFNIVFLLLTVLGMYLQNSKQYGANMEKKHTHSTTLTLIRMFKNNRGVR